MNKVNKKSVASSLMLLMILSQVFVPTIYSASEVNGQVSTVVAGLDDFEQIDDSLVLELTATSDIQISFDYAIENDLDQYDFNLNSKQLDLDADASLNEGTNQLEITSNTADFSSVEKFDVLATNNDKKFISLDSEDPKSGEVKSEETQSEETQSEETQNEEIAEAIAPSTRASYTDHSGVGNQNSSAIGQATYLDPNEETEDQLNTIEEMESTDNSKYISVEDINADLVEETVKGYDLSEGILPYEYDSSMTSSEIVSNIYSKMEYIGSCWQDYPDWSSSILGKKITKNIDSGDTCDVRLPNFGSYYNTRTGEFYPVDLYVTIDFLDFWTSNAEHENSMLAVGISSEGLTFKTGYTEEFQYSLKTMSKDGREVNAPIIYKMTDVDLTSTIGMDSNSLHRLTTYYQDPSTSSYGSYNPPSIAADGDYYGDTSFNYESFYDYARGLYDAGDIGEGSFNIVTSYDETFNRSDLSALTSITNGNGQYTPSERGWNRLKVRAEDNYITVADSWRSNSTETNNSAHMSTDGKDSEFVMIVDSVNTFTSNMSDAFMGLNPESFSGVSQTFHLKPYAFIENTIIEKSVTDGDDNIAQVGDDLTFTIDITNPSSLITLYDVPVRDSLLEDMPSYLTWDGDFTVSPGSARFTGDLTDGSFKLSEIAPTSTISIEYTVHVDEIPDDLDYVINVATDNGEDPEGLCDSATSTPDCDGTETPVDPDTVVEKSVTDASGNGFIESGETLTYTLDITNPNSVSDALNVPVRDSLLETIGDYDYLSWDGNFTVNPSTIGYSGNLADGTFILDMVPAGSTVSISFDIVAGDIPNDVSEIVNLVTDNGSDPIDPTTELPIICVEPDKGIDCDDVVTPVNPDTIIEKSVVDGNENGIAEDGETLTYSLDITNENKDVDAIGVAVRDSLLETIDDYDYLTWDGNFTVNPDTITYSGDLADGTFVLDAVPADSTVTISFDIVIGTIPEDVEQVVNIATDNGSDPVIPVCPPTSGDCSEVITPTSPDTIIEKSVTDENEDGYVQTGETLTYKLDIINQTTIDALDVTVRDSLVEGIINGDYPYLTFNDDVKVYGSKYTGDLATADLVLAKVGAKDQVTIEFTVTVDQIPNDVADILNVATDNGSDPIDPTTEIPVVCPPGNVDCDEAIIPLDPETIIEKSVVDGNENGIAEDGETLTYSLDITNPNTDADAIDVAVRDSLLETIADYDYLTWDGNFIVNPETITYSGDLADGTFVLDTVPADSTVTISFEIVIGTIPDDVTEILNIATDNGSDPVIPVCPPASEDCSEVITPTNTETIIEKSVTDENEDGYVQAGETLTYKLDIINQTTIDALDVTVRDSLVEGIVNGDYPYLTYNNDVEVFGSEYTGDLATADLVLAKVGAKDQVTIEFTVTADEIPNDIEQVLNVATDNGSDPIDPDTNLPIVCPPSSEDCDEAIIPVDPDTIIEKSVVDGNENGIAEDGETLTYSLDITNENKDVDALDVVVRDSLLETIDDYDYLTWGGNFTVNPDTITYSGDLADGTFVLDTVPADSTVTISFDIAIGTIPTDVESVLNIATDNGSDPVIPVCPPTSGDCSEVITPTNPDTIIEKSVTDENEDGFVQTGETLTYKLDIINQTTIDSIDVAVRDSLVEGIVNGDYPYLTYNNDVEVFGSKYTGDLATDDLVLAKVGAKDQVTIEFTVTVNQIPNDVADILNVATDNGSDPIDPTTELPVVCPPGNVDCDEAIIPVDPDTIIEKSVVDGNENGIAEDGETLTYSLDITNENTDADALDVAVRDSLLETIDDYDYLTWDGNFTVSPDTITYRGNLADGTFVLDMVPADSTVTISFDIVIGTIPTDVESVLNIATDNGSDPVIPVCPPASEDCSEVITPTNPDTIIEKSVTDENEDGFVQTGETLTYKLDIINQTTIDALDVTVRDSLVEGIVNGDYSYLTFNNDVEVYGSEYTGDLATADLVLAKVGAKDQVTITFTVTVDQIPNHVADILNVATDNGSDPIDPDTNLPVVCPPASVDCDEAIIPVDPDTIIEKSVVDGNENGIAEDGETLTYSLDITNENRATDAVNVAVRDSLLETIDDYDYLTWDGNFTVNPDTITYSGDLADGTFVLDAVPADSTVTISFDIVIGTIPTDVEQVLNIATDNGSDPVIPVCPPANEDCSEVITPTNPDTIIEKSVTDENEDGFVQTGETLTYKLDIINQTTIDSIDVPVRDSLVEGIANGIYPYLTYNNDVEVFGSKYTGDLATADLVLAKVGAKDQVTIEFTVTVDQIPNDVADILNVATDNGSDPIDPTTEIPVVCPPGSVDCDEAILPVDPETIIEKSVVDSNENGIVEDGETLTYSLDVINQNTDADALDVAVRDSLLETIADYDYLTWDGNFTVSPDTITYSGDLADGTLVLDMVPADSTVTISFDVVVSEIPDDVESVLNIATDNGSDPVIPVCPPASEDCSEVITPTNPDTIIEKSVTDANEDGYVQTGETLTYKLDIINQTTIDSIDVAVRDSLVEGIVNGDYPYLTFNNDVEVYGSEYTGDLATADLVLAKVGAKDQVSITFTVTVDQIPNDIEQVLNVATDNGSDPIDPDTNLPIVCPPGNVDCDEAIIPVDPDTIIEKSLEDKNGNGTVEDGETLIYTLDITNQSTAAEAVDVAVRDSMLESINDYDYLTWDGNFKVSPKSITYSGNFENGTFVLDSIPADSTVSISYNIVVGEVPDDVDQILNVATDNGQDPIDPETKLPVVCEAPDQGVDCDDAQITPSEDDGGSLAITGSVRIELLTFIMVLIGIVLVTLRKRII